MRGYAVTQTLIVRCRALEFNLDGVLNMNKLRVLDHVCAYLQNTHLVMRCCPRKVVLGKLFEVASWLHGTKEWKLYGQRCFSKRCLETMSLNVTLGGVLVFVIFFSNIVLQLMIFKSMFPYFSFFLHRVDAAKRYQPKAKHIGVRLTVAKTVWTFISLFSLLPCDWPFTVSRSALFWVDGTTK